MIHPYFLDRTDFISKNCMSETFISKYKAGWTYLIWTLKVWNTSKSECFKDWHDVINRKVYCFLMTGDSQNAGTLEIVWNHFQALSIRCIQNLNKCHMWSLVLSPKYFIIYVQILQDSESCEWNTSIPNSFK